MSLFSITTASDLDFARIRDDSHPRGAAVRDFFDSLYNQVKDYVDTDFPVKVTKQFHACFWETLLANALKQAAVNLIPRSDRQRSDHGPDLSTSIDGRRFWFEAVAVTRGVGPDRVHDDSNDEGSRLVQDDGVMLRIRNGIHEKFNIKYKKYIEQGVVSPEDGYIIAINTYQLGTDAMLEATVPRIVRCVLPIGHQVAHIDVAARKIVKFSHEFRDQIVKTTGSGVPTTLFQNAAYAGLSAVLCSYDSIYGYCLDCFGNPLLKSLNVDGAPFTLVHNPLATVKLPMSAFEVGAEYWLDGDQLHHTNFKRE